MDGGFIFINEVITMIDTKMKRVMKWHTEGYIDTDPEGFTGTVDLATVLLKDLEGNNGGYSEQVRARCRVRIVDGTFFEKLGGSSKLADILKNHKGVFTTKEHIEKYIKDKWSVRDFGNDASYFTLEIEEES